MIVNGISGAGMALVNRELQESLMAARDAAAAVRRADAGSQRAAADVRPLPVPTGTVSSRVDLYL